MAVISAVAPVSFVVVLVMVKAQVDPVSDKGPVRVAADPVRVADPASALVRVGVGEGRVTAMVPVLVVALGLATVPAPWALVMVQVDPVMVATSDPALDRALVPAPRARVMVQAIQAMADPDTAKPMEYGVRIAGRRVDERSAIRSKSVPSCRSPVD